MNQAWAIALIDRLAHHGIRDAVICPGSRSTPLALAAEHHPDIHTHVQIDERGAAYFALGVAKATRRPTVVITTSGTAVANLLPACIEAHQANVPLLLLTADRPSELRDTGSNQTMHQVGLFDAYTRHAVDAPHPGEGDIEAVVDEALKAMTAWPPGPAHINQPLREPLSPSASEQAALEVLNKQAPRDDAAPLDVASAGPVPIIDPRSAGPRGLIVCGPESGDIAEHLTRLAGSLGAVVLADALSGVRFELADAITGYDAYIDHHAVAALKPDWILQFGHSPTSKSLRGYLGLQTAPRWKVDASGRRWNDIKGNVKLVDCDPRKFLAQMEQANAPAPTAAGTSWAATWKALDTAARQSHRVAVLEEPDMESAWVPHVVAAAERLFVGNSMPVRDLDRFARRSKPLQVFANRGVSGIDGTIATAAGIAQSGPLIAVIGDVAFQHDVGSLAIIPPALRLVIIDNGGGRIFHQLPVSQATAHFDKLFLTKPPMDLEAACAAFGRTCETTTPEDLDEALAGDAQAIIVVTDGEASATTRRQTRLDLHEQVPGILAQHS